MAKGIFSKTPDCGLKMKWRTLLCTATKTNLSFEGTHPHLTASSINKIPLLFIATHFHIHCERAHI